MNLDLAFIAEALLKLLPAVPTTLLLTAVSAFCGLAAGSVLALLRFSRCRCWAGSPPAG